MTVHKKGKLNGWWPLEGERKGADRGAEVAAGKFSPAVHKEGISC